MDQLRAIKGSADFFFVRHGESEGNRDGVIQGRTPSRLTATGRDQARRAGAWFKGKQIQAVLTSPLGRSAETAALISQEGALPAPEPVEDLMEIDVGLFTGMRGAEARERYPAEWKAFQHGSWEAVPGAERIDSLLARAGRVWDLLSTRALAGTTRILCVTHSGFLQWIIRATFGGRTWMPLFSGGGNCGVSHLRVTNTPQDGAPPGHMATWVLINSSIDPDAPSH